MQRSFSWKVICAHSAGFLFPPTPHYAQPIFVFNTHPSLFFLLLRIFKRQDDICEPHDFELGDENYAEHAGEGQGRPVYFAVDATPKDVANSQSYGIYSLPDAELQIVMDAFTVRWCLQRARSAGCPALLLKQGACVDGLSSRRLLFTDPVTRLLLPSWLSDAMFARRVTDPMARPYHFNRHTTTYFCSFAPVCSPRCWATGGAL